MFFNDHTMFNSADRMKAWDRRLKTLMTYPQAGLNMRPCLACLGRVGSNIISLIPCRSRSSSRRTARFSHERLWTTLQRQRSTTSLHSLPGQTSERTRSSLDPPLSTTQRNPEQADADLSILVEYCLKQLVTISTKRGECFEKHRPFLHLGLYNTREEGNILR